jgi:type I restriction enzyme S subunit
LFMKPGNYVASTGYAVIRANENIEYLYQYLHSDIFVNDVITRCTGTSYPSINSKDLEEIFVKIPCQEEQKKIGEFLSLLEDQIKCAGKILEKTEIFKKGLIQQMFI